jgi:hypothetical protein
MFIGKDGAICPYNDEVLQECHWRLGRECMYNTLNPHIRCRQPIVKEKAAR